MKTFERELESLLNSYSKENESDTPDFMLAEYLKNCLESYTIAVTKRDKWFGVNMWAPDKISEQRKKENDKA